MSEYGVSDTLLGIFESIREATFCFNPERLKYRPEAIDEIAKKICSHGEYHNLCYELSFLSWAIVNNPGQNNANNLGPITDFFWQQEVTTPKRFREYFASPVEASKGSTRLSEEHLNIEVSGERFNMSPTRSGPLSVFMEFLLAIDVKFLNEIERKISGVGLSEIKSLSSYLQKQIYDFLKLHLPEVQSRNRFVYCAKWLQSNNLSYKDIDDASILSFWLEASGDKKSEGYVMYDTALSNMLDTAQSFYETAQRNEVQRADSFGDAEVDGEVDIGRIEESIDYNERAKISVANLCKTPKCITQVQVEVSQPLVENQNVLKQCRLSFLRLHTFGAMQAILVQAKRVSQQRVNEKLNENLPGTYLQYVDEIAKTLGALEVAELSLLHILTEYFPSDVLSTHIQVAFSHSSEQSEGLKQFVYDEPHVIEALTQSFSQAKLAELCLRFPVLSHQYKLAASTFKKNTKSGFKELPSEEDIDDYFSCFEQVNALITLLKQHEKELVFLQKSGELDDIYASDLSIFNSRFTELYGETHAI